MTIEIWLRQSINELSTVGVESARLDCLILLEYIMRRDRGWILAHSDISLDASSLQKLDGLLRRRLQREPIAYLVEHKEFIGLDLKVTPDVLIPRPETEQLIELFNGLNPQNNWRVADIGTGSGAIALSVKQKYSSISVTATDVSAQALSIAEKNAEVNHLPINFVKTDLLTNLDKFDAIIANLPYVDSSWQVSPETTYEPSLALFAATEGLELIEKLISQAHDHLLPGGYILLEHDPRQSDKIEQIATKHGYHIISKERFTTVIQ